MGGESGVRAATAQSIEIDFYYQGRRCRERVSLAPTKANLQYARNLRGQILNEIVRHTFDYGKYFPGSPRAKKLAINPAGTMTVSDLLAEYLMAARPTLSHDTFKDYQEFVYNTWLPRFGDIPLSKFTRDDVTTWIAEQTSTKKRILNLLTPLRQALRFAVDPKKYLPADPIGAVKVQRPLRIEEEEIIDPFSKAEVSAALDQLEPQVKHMFKFWAWTGLRQGELIGLTWDRVDFERGIVKIRQTIRAGRTKAVKTKAGNRDVKLLPEALEALVDQKMYTRLIGKEVFLNPKGRVAWKHDKPIRLLWSKALAKASVRYRFPRQLRHTYGTWMLMAGESPRWVAEQMGHEDASITHKHYSRWIEDENPNAGMKAHAMFGDAQLPTVLRIIKPGIVK